MAREPLAGISLPGVHAYAEKSIAAGSTIHFRISSSTEYTLAIYRLGSGMDGPLDAPTGIQRADEVVFSPELFSQGEQPITPGSYVNVDNGLPADVPFGALTLECWVRPWVHVDATGVAHWEKWQGLLTQHTFPDKCGVGLFIGPTGHAHLYLGTGGQHDDARVVQSAVPLQPNVWNHVVGVWDGANASLWVNESLMGPVPLAGPVRPGPAPLRLAAYGDNGFTSKLLDGDLAMPVIHGRALSPLEIQQRRGEKGRHPPALNGVLACWPLSEERGSHLNDISGNGRHGQIINGATWMIGGPGFDGNQVPRFGHQAPDFELRGHGLRFASDDLYDCGWQVTASKQLGADLTPGLYVGRIRHGPNFAYLYDVTFVVKKAAGRPRAPILVVCSTSTWLAYNGAPFAPNYKDPQERREWWGNALPYPADDAKRGPAVPGAPVYNFYLNHRHGQPTYKVGLNVPWPVASPYAVYWSRETGYGHLVRAERYLHDWLGTQGYAFDVITDFDLHRDPSALDGYKVVILNGHSEYWSAPAYESLERYLRKGGRNITLSGNTMCWRVSFDDNLTAMECRKSDRLGGHSGGREGASYGECYHSDDGRRGGLMRDCGYPSWAVLGLESVGFQTESTLRSYVCANANHKFFNDPIVTGVVQGATFAPGAIGHEWDVRFGMPQQGNLDYEGSGMDMEVLAYSEVHSTDRYWDYFFTPIAAAVPGHRVSEMVYWRRPQGGEVFFAGSIAAGMALKGTPTDNRWASVLVNVLMNFGVPAPIR